MRVRFIAVCVGCKLRAMVGNKLLIAGADREGCQRVFFLALIVLLEGIRSFIFRLNSELAADQKVALWWRWALPGYNSLGLQLRGLDSAGRQPTLELFSWILQIYKCTELLAQAQRRSTCPDLAPVGSPLSRTSTPLTHTFSTPLESTCPSLMLAWSCIVSGSKRTRSALNPG